MLRLIASILVVAVGIGLLLPQTARAQQPPLGPCFAFDLHSAAELLPRVAMVVIGRVSGSETGRHAVIAPEAYLKGPTSAETLVLPYPEPDADCPPGELVHGDRVLLVLGREGARVAWPGESQVFRLADGKAHQAGAGGASLLESELIERIRSHTGQYSIPAESDDEGARIDWSGTVLPVGAAAIVVFAIGLVLMREWHRIDPS